MVTRILHLLIVSGILQSAAHSQTLQIIHTNDLHATLLESSRSGWGGWAEVKSIIHSIRKDASDQNIEVLQLDAGDFLEGSAFYFADRGRRVFKTMNEMGYDAVTMGNHEYTMGAADLNLLLNEVPPLFKFLAANLEISDNLPHAKKHIQPYVSIQKGSLKIAIIGLTTDNPLYTWYMNAQDPDSETEGSSDRIEIQSPLRSLKRHIKNLRSNHDLVIALTHLGISKDLELAKRYPEIDLIVGGHSHSELHQPVWVIQPAKQIPIFQSGEHGNFVGSIKIDVNPTEPVRVLSHELVPVKNKSLQNSGILRHLFEAFKELSATYGVTSLFKPLAFSATPLEVSRIRTTPWGQFVVDSFKKATQTELAFDFGRFHGLSQPAGHISLFSLMNLYPRVFETYKTSGLTLWKSKTSGFFIKKLIKTSRNLNIPLQIAGMETTGPIIGTRKYDVTFPESFVRGLQSTRPALAALMGQSKDTKISVWSAIQKNLTNF